MARARRDGQKLEIDAFRADALRRNPGLEGGPLLAGDGVAGADEGAGDGDGFGGEEHGASALGAVSRQQLR